VDLYASCNIWRCCLLLKRMELIRAGLLLGRLCQIWDPCRWRRFDSGVWEYFWASYCPCWVWHLIISRDGKIVRRLLFYCFCWPKVRGKIHLGLLSTSGSCVNVGCLSMLFLAWTLDTVWSKCAWSTKWNPKSQQSTRVLQRKHNCNALNVNLGKFVNSSRARHCRA